MGTVALILARLLDPFFIVPVLLAFWWAWRQPIPRAMKRVAVVALAAAVLCELQLQASQSTRPLALALSGLLAVPVVMVVAAVVFLIRGDRAPPFRQPDDGRPHDWLQR